MSNALVKAKKPIKILNYISERAANKRAAGAAVVGGVVGGTVGYHKGKKDGLKKKASANKYLEKLAGIGDVGKALIKTKLAPALSKMNPVRAGNLSSLSRAASGSKVAPKIYSVPEYAQHSSNMGNLAKKLMPGMKGTEANKIFAVATRARKMGVI